MNEERRYDEEEARLIFAAATEAEASRPASPGRGGLTLAELQEIAAEAGIPPRLVSEAAARLGAGAHAGEAGTAGPGGPGGATLTPHLPGRLQQPSAPRLLGLPLGVQREVALPRDLTEEEWASLVMDARRTFSARGRVEAVGRAREWRNGNLYVAAEPDGEGAHLRMGSRKESAIRLTIAGSIMLAFALVLLVAMVVTGEIAEAGAFLAPALIGTMGLGAVGAGPLRLPGWAKERARQMEWLGERALALTEKASRPPGEDGGTGRPDDRTLGPA